MRSHAIVLPQFWTGPSGKRITAAGKDTRILATYLLTCDHSNMIGLYRLPLLYASAETGLTRREILSALDRLRLLDFAFYDPSSEFVWVREMARIQLGLLCGESLKDGDKRTKGVAAQYKHLPSNPFLGPFHDRYAAILRLPLRRDQEAEKKALGSPIEGASEPLARGPIPDPDPDPDLRKGETGETKPSEGEASSHSLNGHKSSFEIFWRAYPKKRGKGPAEKAWARIKPDDMLLGTMLAKIDQAKQTSQWTKDRGEFIPHPATWLNAKGWEDEYETAATSTAKPPRIPL